MNDKNKSTLYKQFPKVKLLLLLLPLFVFWLGSAPSSLAASNPALRRYPYLTDVVGSYATINWGTDRSQTSGAVRYGKVGSESCTAHYVPATKTAITVNSVLQYQWKAQLNLLPGTQYCYRVYLGSSPTTEIDLLGSDTSPSFWTQVPMGATGSFSFAVFGDWGYVNSSGTNPYQANVMSRIASSGARFAVTTGDNGYPSGNQKNYGDLVQTGADTSAVFGPSFWAVPGRSMPIFLSMGNHGLSSSDTNHPALLTWPQDRAVAMSDGRHTKDVYCCLNGTNSASYPSIWYAFDAGPARFYVLKTAWAESNSGTADPYKNDYDYHWAPGTPQWEWLKADLVAHPSVLKFAFFHYPLYSDNPNEAASPYLLGSTGLEGLLKQHSVDIAFTGHAHIYERNLPSASGVYNYITGGGGATLGTLGTCTALDAYAIKFTTTGKACGSAPVPTSADEVYHFLKVTVNGSNVTVTPINSLGQSFDVRSYSFPTGAETTAPTVPGNLNATASGGTQVSLSWSASSDNTGVRGYGVYRNATLIATVDKDTLTYSDTNLTPSTSYTYRVDAFDGSGNHSAQSASRSVTTQSTAIYNFPALADSYVAADFATTNYGLSGTLKADASPDYRSYMRFNVNEIAGNVMNATLRLYTTSSASTGIQVQRVAAQTWEESSITYANAPAVGPVIGSSGSFASGNWVSVDVTSLITGHGVYDLAITTTNPNVMNFNSRDASSNHPELIVQTTTGTVPTPTVTQTSPAGTPTVTQTATPLIDPGNTFTFTTVADARVAESSPTTNYGTATTLQADGDVGIAQRSFIRFTASGITGPIKRATLRVFCTTNGTANGPAVYLANSSWTESGSGGVTWNTQPGLLSGVADNKGAFGTDTWVEYDVTSLVSGDGTYTFALVADSNDGVTFSSREGTVPPQLVVETLGAATGTPTFTPVVTQTATVTSTVTATPSPTPTILPTITSTATQTGTPTSNFTATATSNPVSTLTGTATVTPIVTGPPTSTFTPAPTATQTAGVTATSTATATIDVGSTFTFTTVADARVVQASPTTNYGTSTTLQVDGDTVQTSYIRFNASGISGPIQNVKLRILCTTNGTADGPVVYMAGSNWIESGTGGITWNTQPALISAAGDNKGAIATNSWVEYDVTAFVTGNGTYTFALVADGNDGITFSSREGTAAPQLVVVTQGGPVVTSTLTATSTSTPTSTLTPANTSTATVTPTNSPTASYTPTSTPTATATPSFTSTAKSTDTFTATATSTAIPTASHTPTPTLTLTPSQTATLIPVNTSTWTPTATPSATLTSTSTPSQTSTLTPTETSIPSSTATPTATATLSSTETMPPTLFPTATSTFTPLPTFTDTPAATWTATTTPSRTQTATDEPTVTATPSRTQTATEQPTDIPTASSTPSQTRTPTQTATNIPTDTATSTPDNTPTRTPTVTHTFTPTVTPPPLADPIFEDGFESGDLSAWSFSVTDSDSLSVTPAAALDGNFGLQVEINDNNSIYVMDDTPDAETRYRTRFYFDPNSISMADKDALYILNGYNSSFAEVLRVEFRIFKGVYQLRTSARSDSNSWATSSWIDLIDVPHVIELSWSASTTAGANNGSLILWVDEVQFANLVRIDNDTRRIDQIRWGAVAEIDIGTRGILYFDAFASTRQSYIGPVSTPTP